ncbi:MAG: hypothetical protein HY288_08010 [Planctomycetia bacterium]|nr:hypothetical protein [Planctomycetia bacterium]
MPSAERKRETRRGLSRLTWATVWKSADWIDAIVSAAYFNDADPRGFDPRHLGPQGLQA